MYHRFGGIRVNDFTSLSEEQEKQFGIKIHSEKTPDSVIHMSIVSANGKWISNPTRLPFRHTVREEMCYYNNL
jgi:hypothetical protein